jgi:hypothetical protein
VECWPASYPGDARYRLRNILIAKLISTRTKFIGRWRDGTPVAISPDSANQEIVKDKQRNVNVTFSNDPDGAVAP